MADPGMVEHLERRGVLRAAAVIDIAHNAGLGLAEACTMLEKESGGGRNVFGSDGVSTGGAYRKGEAVTEENYKAYKAARLAKRAGAQGVGPTQLTWPPLQIRADELGGCWRPEVNMRVGFEHLRDLIKAYGTRGGFRRYNGSGPAAERYADDAMAKLTRWHGHLAAYRAPAAPPAAPGGSQWPVLREGDSGPAVAKWQGWLRGQGYAVSVDGDFGPQTKRETIRFQKGAGLAGDGIVGRDTYGQAFERGFRG